MSSQTDPFQGVQLTREHLHRQIADQIQELIAAKQLRPGDHLPSERELARLFGVSSVTVYGAVLLLQQRGLLNMKVGSGTFVIDTPVSVIADSVERYLAFGNCSDEALVRFREILDPEAAAMAAEQATDEDVARLGEYIQQIEEAIAADVVERYAAADMGFHEALAAATHNELVSAVVSGIRQEMQRWIESQSPGTFLVQPGSRSHRPIYEAVVARDPSQAREAMRLHMRHMRGSLSNPRKVDAR
jgi:GntR family transcriptional regulator, transcriptional repressor for pyruvate dehydrogenase complex